jgi:hypothetical protein
MVNLIPGALWQPIDVGDRARRRKGRAVVGHIAVSNSANLRPGGTPASRSADWHAYLPKAGGIVQYIDLDRTSWATRDGNGSVVAWESQGGVGEDVHGPWTDGQLEAAAVILAYLNETEGTPLEVMPDSRPASKGMGVHRLGVDPWRVAGGELWSSARGKTCPGNARVLQVPTIVDRARQLRGGSPAAPMPSPAPSPAPAGPPPVPALPPFGLPRGHYYGLVTGPARSHGGYYASERPAILAAQRRLIAKGYVPGVSDWRSGWADGVYEQPTADAVARFQRAEMPGTQYFGQLWSDDWARLGR